VSHSPDLEDACPRLRLIELEQQQPLPRSQGGLAPLYWDDLRGRSEDHLRNVSRTVCPLIGDQVLRSAGEIVVRVVGGGRDEVFETGLEVLKRTVLVFVNQDAAGCVRTERDGTTVDDTGVLYCSKKVVGDIDPTESAIGDNLNPRRCNLQGDLALLCEFGMFGHKDGKDCGVRKTSGRCRDSVKKEQSAPTPDRAPPDGYDVRPARREEAAAVAQLIAACEQALGVSPTMFEEDIVRQWTDPRFDMSTDTWVLTRAADMVGYAQLEDTRSDAGLETFGLVHPDHQGQGLGWFLVAETERRARLQAARWSHPAELNHIIVSGDEAARALVERAGYKRVRSFWHMTVDLTAPLAIAQLPDGVELRAFEVERDRRAVHELMERAFSQHYGFAPETFDEWWRPISASSEFDPGLWLLAWHQDELVAGVIGGRRGHDAWVHDVGVLPRWRRRGLAWSLLSRLLMEFKKRGYGQVGLNVDALNDTGATALYERMGFGVRTAFDFYRKSIAGNDGTKALYG
jgi:mycothiol synthase